MTVSIRLKHSAVQDKAPLPADLANGELALNINADSPALYLKDSAGNVIKVAGVTGSATAPTSPATGTVWIDSSQTPNVINVWDGTAWVPQAGATVASNTAPATPVTGQIWVNTGVAPEVTQIWNGTGWITLDASGSDAQAISNDAKYATKAELAAEDLWDRTGTVVSPTNAGDDIDTDGSVHVASNGYSATGAAIVGSSGQFRVRPSATTNDAIQVYSGTAGALADVQFSVRGDGRILAGSHANPAVSLDPGSSGVPLVRDSAGRLLVGMNNAPTGTLAGDVVCQGAVVLQSPNGMWWAIEVDNSGNLSVAQTSVR